MHRGGLSYYFELSLALDNVSYYSKVIYIYSFGNFCSSCPCNMHGKLSHDFFNRMRKNCDAQCTPMK